MSDENSSGTNAPVTGTSEIVLGVGGTMSSEMLDSLEEGTSSAAADEVTRAAEKQIAVGAKAEELKQSQAKTELKAAIKKWKALTGDGSELELSDDLKLRIPVNKEDRDVSLDELIKSYNGNETWHKIIPQKFSELDLEKKKFRTEMDAIDLALKDMIETSKTNPLEGFRKAAKMAYGKDDDTFLGEYIQKLQPEIEKWQKMTPEEKNRIQQEHSIKTREKEIAKKEKEISQVRARAEFEEYGKNLLGSKGITEDEAAAAWPDIAEKVKESMPDADPKTILTQVVRYVELKKQYDKIGEAAGNVEASLAQDPAYLQRIARFVDPDFTTSDIEDIIRADIGRSVSNDTDTSQRAKSKPASKPAQKPAPKRESSARSKVTDESLEDGFLSDL